MNHLIAAGIAVAAMLGAYQIIKTVGVQTERARVETIGKKSDAKAGAVRKKVAAKKPSEIQRDLARYCNDC